MLIIIKKTFNNVIFCLIILAILTVAVKTYAQKTYIINGGKLSIEYNDDLNSRVISVIDGKDKILGEYSLSEYLILEDGKIEGNFKFYGLEEKSIQDKIGKGKEYIISGSSKNLSKHISVISYEDFPTALFFNVTYQNTSNIDITINAWINNHYKFSAKSKNTNQPLFWSYQPGSYGWDNDWIQKLNNGFERENYLGMNNVDYGGGTPVLDIWREDIGLAIGHIEIVPKFVSLPTSVKNNEAQISIKYLHPITLKPGESFSTFKTFVSVHHKDHYLTLTDYSKIMARQGIDFKEAPEDAYGTEWCGWGYEKNFTMEQFYGAFPMIKKLGMDCVTLDYGWDTGVGDYYLAKDKFPNGDADMRKVVDSIHSIGAKARLWWMPLSVYPKTDLFTDHSDYMLLNKDQSPVFIQFWKSFFLCPATEEVRTLTRDFVVKALRDWGYDGLKIDGNNLNTVPLCYNPTHNHARPEESVEELPELYKIIFETALSINPKAVIQICPCGTNQSFYILPYMNQTVASDPHSSWHVRIKGKTLHALTQQKITFAGDHVELSDNKSDFASTVGIGGVIATKFVWPVGSHENKETGDIALTPEKEKKWTKWINIYNDHMLSKGIYKGELYDIGFDRPETHAIQKDDVMYYSFYANSFKGEVELRGLENRRYTVFDYENNKEIGTVNGPTAKLPISFNSHLLIKAEPK